MESINKYLSYEQQLKNLESKKLVFPDDKSRDVFLEYLKEYNYSNFVLGLKNKLMFDSDGNYKKEFTSNNLRYLFDIDRNISAIMWKYFKGLELHLNSSVIKVIAEAIQSKTNTPYLCCLSEVDFDDIFSNLSDVNYFETKAVIKKKMFIEEFYKNYDTIHTFNDVADRNLDQESDDIIRRIDNSWIKKRMDTTDKRKKKWIYIQIFTLCASFSFSQILKVYKAVNMSLKNKIIYEFSKNIKKYYKVKMTDKDMNDLMGVMSKLRNALAHNGCMIKHRGYLSNDSKIFDFFELEKNVGYKSTFLYLNDFVKIIEKIRGMHDGKIIEEIFDSIKYKIKQSNNKDEVSPLLYEIIEYETKFVFPKSVKNVNKVSRTKK